MKLFEYKCYKCKCYAGGVKKKSFFVISGGKGRFYIPCLSARKKRDSINFVFKILNNFTVKHKVKIRGIRL